MTDGPKPIDLDAVTTRVNKLHELYGVEELPVIAIDVVDDATELIAAVRERDNYIAHLEIAEKGLTAERDALKVEVEQYRETEAYVGVSLDIERDALRDRVVKLEAYPAKVAALLRGMADTQDHFAATAYSQHADAQRQAYRHGACILREAADRVERRAAELLREGSGK